MKMPRGLPSASRLQLAMACPASQALGQVDTAWAAGEKGNEKHAALDAHCDSKPPGAAHAEWLAGFDGETIELLKGMRCEVTYAYDYPTGHARSLGDHLERAYGSANATEYVGTVDYVGVVDTGITIVDLKTGMADVPHPSRNMQLRMLALAACRTHNAEKARVGILHAPEGRQPWMEWATVDAFELQVIATQLRDLAQKIEWARNAADKNKLPWLTAGEHCTYCPARFTCPTRVAMARAMATAPDEYGMSLKHSLDDDAIAGAALARWRAAKKILDEVGSALYARAKERPIPLADGRAWGPKAKETEEIDAEKAWTVLAKEYGPEAARVAMSLDTSKAGVERMVRHLRTTAGLAGTLKELHTEALRKLRDAGCVTTKRSEKYEEFTPALPAAV